MEVINEMFSRVYLKKIVVFVLVFGFILTPLAPVFAKISDTPAPPAGDTGSTGSIVDPTIPVTISDPPSDSVSPVDVAPVDISPTDNTDPSLDVPDTKDSKKDKLDKKDNGTVASPEAMSLMAGSDSSGTGIGLTPSTIKQLLPDANQSSGGLTYSYPIVVPPGRNGMQPGLMLSYSSQMSADVSVFGSGWDINIPTIERLNKTGTDKIYTDNYFTSSLDGELVSIGSGGYSPKIENGSYLKYSLSGNAWIVTDKNGTTYKFGTAAGSSQDDPNDTSKVYKWLLDEVRDKNGNYVKYEYYKDAGQIYPSVITYTGNGSTDGIFTVEFSRESRADVNKSFKTKFSVVTNYRISQIQSKVSGTWAHKYVFGYESGGNGARSLLTSITESGQDDSSTTTTLPAISFSHQVHQTDWTQNTSWSLPVPLVNNVDSQLSAPHPDSGVRLGDVNGDGLTDVLYTYYAGYNPASEVYINTGGGWALNSAWTIPVSFLKYPTYYNTPQDNGVRLADVNGDGLIDLLYTYYDGSYNPLSKVYLNNGSGWTENTSWSIPIQFVSTSPDYPDNGVRVSDVNGDGLIDLLYTYYVGTGVPNSKVYLNNGSTGWTEDTSWSIPVSFLTYLYPQDTGVVMEDANGDGLTDLLKTDWTWMGSGTGWVSNSKVYINMGGGWTQDTNWSVPVEIMSWDVSHPDNGVRFSDVNGDGLSDLLYSYFTGQGIPHSKVYLNNGSTGWTEDTSWSLPVSFIVYGNPYIQDNGARLADVNGDGLVDVLHTYYAGYPSTVHSEVFMNNGPRADFVSTITYPAGGTTSVIYKPSAQYMNGSAQLNPNLPLNLDTVYQITNSDGTISSTSTYKYEGGKYYFGSNIDRRFAGFAAVTKTDTASNTIKNYFHQGNSTDSSHGEYSDDASKIGKIYRTEIANGSGNIYSKTINKWDKYNLGTGRDFVKLVQTVQSTYDGDSSHKDKAETYTYSNSNGNLTQKIEYGQVTGSDDGTFTDTGSDDFTSTIDYATDSGYVIGLPKIQTVTDHGSTKVKESKFYYDAQAYGGVTKGNLTKQEDWKTGSTYVNVQKTYNSTYGTLASDIDPRGKTTTYTNDSNNLYPATVTNPLSQATSYTYDYSSGKVLQKTDANTRVFQSTYDGLDRVVAEKQPDYTTPSTLVTRTVYVYTDTSGAVAVRKTDNLDSSTARETYQYFDGLGRLIQSRTEAEGSNYEVVDKKYNNLEQVDKDSLPYFSSGSSKTSPTATASLYTSYTYDAMLRPVTVVNNLGTTTNTYNDWKLTVADANSKTKDLYKDAYGNLVQVDEHNSGSTYSTYYLYNYLGNLTKITDALGNIRNFTYDALGRRLTAQDLHASADTTYFGSYSYTYDDAGNLTQQINPNSQTTNYTYDDVNRTLTEDYTGGAGTEVTNTYDSGTDGKGHLTGIASPTLSQTNTYNPVGGLKSEAKTLNSVVYTTTYDYDRLGNQINITNPDSSQVKNIYNSAGLLNQTQRKESTDGSFINVISNFDYSPTEQPTTVSYQNGATTTNTYDSTKLYRLIAKVTTIAASAHAQDLAYTYDAVGNITQIVDNSATNTKKTMNYVYDDLYRLISATSTNDVLGNNYFQAYEYNPIGDLIYKSDAGTYAYTGNTGTSYANPHAVTSITANPSSGTELLTIPWFLTGNNGSDEKYVTPAANILNGKQSITVTYNLHGICALGGDASAIIFDQSGWKYVSLSDYGTNCLDGVQTVTIPLSAFPGLNTSANLTGAFHSRIWYGSAFHVEILSAKLNTTATVPAATVTTYSYDNNGNLVSSGVAPAWYSTGGTWTTRKQITVDHTKVSGSSALTNFPVLVSVTDTDLKTVANGGHVGKSDGTDILFTSSDGVTKLSHEIEKYDASTGQLIAWVKVPSLSNSIDTKLIVYYGNASASDQQDKINVWDSNYKAIYHVNNSLNDSTSNAKNLTNTSSTDTSSGKIGNARAFNGSSQAAYTTSLPITATDNYTISAWAYANNTTGEQVFMSTGYDGGAAGSGYSVEVESAHWKSLYNGVTRSDSGTNVTTGTWSYLTLRRSGGTSQLYLNGNAIGSTFANTPNTPSTIFSIGAQGQSSTPTYFRYFNGSVDQVEISSTARSTDWITTEYNNQNSPSTFETLGSVTGNTNSNTWDYNNRLTQSVVGAVTTTYNYDPSGQRTKYSNGTTTSYYPSKFYNTDGSTAKKHVFAQGMEVSVVNGTGASATARYNHTDHLTGSGIVTNASNTADETLDYYPFGSIRIDSGTYSDQRKFTGYEFDADTGLNYAGARYYDAGSGKFVSQDPVFLAMGDSGRVKQLTQSELHKILADPQTLNSYAYARNNPLRIIDPSGEWIWDFVTGKQSWNSFMVEAGDAANYLYDNNSAWRAAMNNPAGAGLVIGTGSAIVAYAGAVGLTNLSINYLGGLGTTCMAFCTKAANLASQMSVRESLLNTAQDSKLKSIINELYRAKARIGDGGTADALRHEIRTGELLSPSGHFDKAVGRITQLTKYLNNPNINNTDRSIAEDLVNDLKDAVNMATKK